MTRSPIRKEDVLSALRAKIDDELAAAIRAQKTAHQGATHEQSRAENDKDTRALEASYLARGLAERVADLHDAKAALPALPAHTSTVALGALVIVEDEEGDESAYVFAPNAGGLNIEVDGAIVKVVTPGSPLGRALLGKGIDDEATVKTPGGTRELLITRVS